MFIQVQLLNGFKQPLWYAVPESWDKHSLRNKIVQVPLQNRICTALVIYQVKEKPRHCNFTIKPAYAVEPFPQDKHYFSFIEKLAQYHQTEPMHFIKRMKQFVYQKETKTRKSAQPLIENKFKHVELTQEQQNVVNFLIPKVTQNVYTPTLLHGVTGSGKTEAYKKLIMHTLTDQKTVLLLLPEVTLASQFTHLLRAQLPEDIQLFDFHSGTTPKNKKLLWKALLEQKPIIIIGVHLPVLLPIANLGLIIVDEEHETGYQEKKHPKINSKEAAIWRAHLNNVPILLGSATPSVTSLYNVKKKGWHFFQLKKRFAGAFPKIQTVLLADKKQRKNFWVSQKLYSELKDRLAKREQSIIFLNRRGISFFVQCKTCSFIFECKNCSVSLTLHGNNILACHYCGLQKQQPPDCPSCKGPEKDFIKKGIGTQQMVTILQKMFPQAIIARADMDTTTKKKTWQETVQKFENNEIDILVGTQSITKGFHFPNVTLVGIIWADLNLNFPLFNASETTLQQLIQVAGRAGRQRKESTVIVQTMAEHHIFNYLNETDYLKFFTDEVKKRSTIGYPPCQRLAEIELKSTDETLLENESFNLVDALIKNNNNTVQILGPAKPPVSKIKKTHIRKIYLKSPKITDIAHLFSTLELKNYKSSVFFTPNPVN